MYNYLTRKKKSNCINLLYSTLLHEHLQVVISISHLHIMLISMGLTSRSPPKNPRNYYHAKKKSFLVKHPFWGHFNKQNQDLPWMFNLKKNSIICRPKSYFNMIYPLLLQFHAKTALLDTIVVN